MRSHFETGSAQIEDRAVPGHSEGDLPVGGHHGQIARWLAERKSR
jgi:hypothetical protein